VKHRWRRLVRRFVNSRDIEEGSEALHSPDSLLTWFASMDLLNKDGATADEKDLERALALREGIRDLLLANRPGLHPRPKASVARQVGDPFAQASYQRHPPLP
jgi:hypothetical protein